MRTSPRPGPILAVLALAAAVAPPAAQAFHKKVYVAAPAAAPTYAAAPTAVVAAAPAAYVAQAPANYVTPAAAPAPVYYQAQVAAAPAVVAAAPAAIGAAPGDDTSAGNQVLTPNLRVAMYRDLTKFYRSKDNPGDSLADRIKNLRDRANESYASMVGLDSADDLGPAPKQDIDLLVEQVVGQENVRPAGGLTTAAYCQTAAMVPMAAPAPLILVQPVTPVLLAPVAPHHSHLHNLFHHYP